MIVAWQNMHETHMSQNDHHVLTPCNHLKPPW